MSISAAENGASNGKSLGLRELFRNPGLFFLTVLKGRHVGSDAQGNQYYERPGRRGAARSRRWVVYAGAPDASVIGPQWHSWLHHLTETPLLVDDVAAWRRPHKPNLTGTPDGYRPDGHDYKGGARAKASADYEAWTPEPG